MQYTKLVLALGVFGVLVGPIIAQEPSGIDPEALIERILAVDRVQRDQIEDITFEAEYVEREDKGSEGIKEKLRFVKMIYIKCLEDTSWFTEEYLEYYKDGERKSDDDLRKEASERKKKKIKRQAHDISYPMLKPFYPEQRPLYGIDYLGVADETVDDRVCHHFRVTANEEADSLICGDFYFEAENFRLVRVDFSPSKLIRKLMFRLKELNMSILYGPTPDGYWLPRQFDIQGKGRAAFFIGVNFAGTEYYRNPLINTGLDNSIFEVNHGR